MSLVLKDDNAAMTCEIVSRQFSGIVCVTLPSPSSFEANVLNVAIDFSAFSFVNLSYHVTPDPVILSVTPEKSIYR